MRRVGHAAAPGAKAGDVGPSASPKVDGRVRPSCPFGPSSRCNARVRWPMQGAVELLDPTLDVVFKLLLTSEEDLLRDMLEGVLGRAVRALTVLDADIPGELVGGKTVILDIRAQLDDGSRVDVEMQVRIPPTLRSRLVYYGARDFTAQLARGDDYDRLTPTVVIVWTVEPLFPDLDQLHSIFELRERNTHQLFGDQLAIHVLQLGCVRASSAAGEDARVERWARFLTARDPATLDQLAKESPVMSLAKQTLEALSQDPKVQRLARERAEAQIFYRMDLAASREEAEREGREAGLRAGIAEGLEEGRRAGLQEGRRAGLEEGRRDGRKEGRKEGRRDGRKEGRAGLLLELLALRFGDPSAVIRARVEAASIEELDAWAKRVLTAESLDEVLAP
jgi:predicted transposase/invertase (TIGR01784 family)